MLDEEHLWPGEEKGYETKKFCLMLFNKVGSSIWAFTCLNVCLSTSYMIFSFYAAYQIFLWKLYSPKWDFFLVLGLLVTPESL